MRSSEAKKVISDLDDGSVLTSPSFTARFKTLIWVKKCHCRFKTIKDYLNCWTNYCFPEWTLADIQKQTNLSRVFLFPNNFVIDLNKSGSWKCFECSIDHHVMLVDVKKRCKKIYVTMRVCAKKWPKWSGQNQLCGVLGRAEYLRKKVK